MAFLLLPCGVGSVCATSLERQSTSFLDLGLLLGWSFGLIRREPTARSLVVPPCRKVLVITHEKARLEDIDDYFAKKFSSLQMIYLIGRSYKASPECEPDVTLFDAWKELVGRRFVSVTLSGFAQDSKSRWIFGAYRPTKDES